MKLPAPYISHSQFYLFHKDPMEYYQQYYVGRLDEPTLAMKLGKIFQQAWCDPNFDYARELKKVGMTSDYARVIKTACEHPTTTRLPMALTEHRSTLKGKAGLKYPILAIFDGLDKKQKLLVENKMGRVWTQEDADTADQVTWYAMVCYYNYGFNPKILLQSFNSKNGMPTIRETKRNVTQFKELVTRINAMVDRIESGNFEVL